jgi:lipid II:glycine glycyltransferase (peptidoglycan interpeptide bridge formation enzyme)
MTNATGREMRMKPDNVPSQWDRFVADHSEGHILQTGEWGELKRRFGWSAEALLWPDADHARSGAQILYRRAAGLTMAYVPRGPLMDWSDEPTSAATLDSIAERGRARGASVLKIEPGLIDSPTNRARLIKLGFRPSSQTVQPPSTVVVDLRGTEDEILARMKSKWRYNIRLAQRKGVSVRAAGPSDLPTVQRLMRITGERDGFEVHSAEYYAAAYALFVPDLATFLLAEYQGEVLGVIIVFALGETAWYLWGASSNVERNRMPNYALQWAGMRWAREHGASKYDFWGIPDPIGIMAVGMAAGSGSGLACERLPLNLSALPRSDLWGVYRFKQGFGGDVVRYVGAWDRPIRQVGHRAYLLGLTARRRLGDMGESGLRAALAPPKRVVSSPVQRSAVETEAAWQDLLAGLPAPHLLQSWPWGEIKNQTDWHADRLMLQSGKRTIGAAQFLWRQPFSGSPLRVGYVPKGPVLDWSNLQAVNGVLGQIELHARKRNCIFVKIDPDVEEESFAGRQLQHMFFRRNWRFSTEQIQFKNTAYTDLALDEAALLAAMKSKWRYNVRLATKRGICVRNGTVDDLAGFYDLYRETAIRDGFLIRPRQYYQQTWQTFLDAQAAGDSAAGGALLLAEHPSEALPVAALFLLRYADRVWYFYGASSDRRRRDMPNYLLQWEALRWSKSQGCNIYDWWGAPTDLDDPDDGMQGVWRFKQGFGAEFRRHVGAWDFVVSPQLYRGYHEILPRLLGLLRR